MQPSSIAYDAYLAAVNALLRCPSHQLRLGVMRTCGRNEVGEQVALERGITLYCKGGVSIGDYCNINAGVILDGRGGISIGSHVVISSQAAILTADHDPHSPEFAGRHRGVIVADNTWIATRAMLLPGSEVREGAVVGAGAVVHGVVPEWTIVAGNPATHVADRSPSAGPTDVVYRRWFH